MENNIKLTNMFKSSFLIALCCLLLLPLSCSKKSADSHVPKTVHGYTVHLVSKEATDSYTEHVYCFTKAKKMPNISFEVVMHNDGKSNLRISYKDFFNTKSYIISFAEQMKLLDAFIKEYFTETSSKKIFSIEIPLVFAADINGEITNEYKQRRGRVRLEKLVLRSRMSAALDSIFAQYGLHVEKVYIEKWYLTDKQIVKEEHIEVSDYDALPRELCFGYADFVLAADDKQK